MVVCLVGVSGDSPCPCLWPGVILLQCWGQLRASDFSFWCLSLGQESIRLFSDYNGCEALMTLIKCSQELLSALDMKTILQPPLSVLSFIAIQLQFYSPYLHHRLSALFWGYWLWGRLWWGLNRAILNHSISKCSNQEEFPSIQQKRCAVEYRQ